MTRAWMALTTIGAVAALMMPASASAALSPSDFKNASKYCKALKVDMGATTFKHTYGTNANRSNAHGKCVSKHVRLLDAIHRNAAKECKGEQAADQAAFDQTYGTNKSKSNAYGRCVSSKAKAASEEQQEATVNAAKQCKAERAQGAAVFRDEYGTNRNNRNAFGKCVSQHAKPDTTSP